MNKDNERWYEQFYKQLTIWWCSPEPNILYILERFVESKKECCDQATKTELKKSVVIKQPKHRVIGLDLIEAVPYHEQFIHTFEEAIPRG